MDGDINGARVRVVMGALTKGLDDFIETMLGVGELITKLLDGFLETRSFAV